MVNAIENLYILSGSFGNELTLNWNYPGNLPEKYSLSLFRKTADFTANELDGYFSILTDIETIELLPNPTPLQLDELAALYESLFVWGETHSMLALTLKYKDNVYTDLDCENGTTYFYRLYLKNSVTHELSAPASASAAPAVNVIYKADDVKSLVKAAVERAIQSVTPAELGQTTLIEVFNEYLTDEDAVQWIIVHKSSNEIYQNFFGESISELDNKVITGHIEKMVIDVTWYFKDDLTKLDILNNFFRSRTEFIKRFLLHSSLIDVQFSFENNSVDTANVSYNLFSSGMRVTVLAEVTNQLTLDTAPIIPDFIPGSPDY
jgi:hypothetical protein